MGLEINEKWGFGMAPPKPRMQNTRLAACDAVLKALNSREYLSSDRTFLENISLVKGLFNRVAREDQWDWFTVAGQFGYPSGGLSGKIAEDLSNLRSAIRDGDNASLDVAYLSLSRLPTRLCLSSFIGKVRIRDEEGAGWIYILSTRELRDLLKIGMTTRTVELRANEINAATGVVIPFGVRRCWRVLNPSLVEKIVHAGLARYRVRNDREFFRLDLYEAAKITHEVISGTGLEVRTLNALAALQS
jgi:hypothetical protein